MIFKAALEEGQSRLRWVTLRDARVLDISIF